MPDTCGEQHGRLFGLPADDSVEGVLFTWADPLAFGSAPALSRWMAGQTSDIVTAMRVKR